MKAQVWITDLMMSVLLFSLACIVTFAIIMNTFDSEEDFKSTTQDSTRIGNYLLSDGVPETWNATSVIRPGINSYHRINSSKVETVMAMSNSSYEALKAMMQTQNDFIVVFENKSGSTISFGNYCVIGNPDAAVEKTMNATLECSSPDFSTISHHNLAKITRFTVYNSQIIKMNIYTWN